MSRPSRPHVLLLSMHTSPADQPGTGDAGGMNVYVWHLAHALAHAGWAVDMATLDRDPSHSPGVRLTDIAPGVRLLTVALAGATEVPKDGLAPFARAFGESLAQHYDDDAPLLHAHYWLSGVAGLHMARVLGTPLVLTLHTSAAAKNLRAGSDESPEPAARETAERELVARACRTVVNTPAEQQQVVELYGANPEGVVVIPPGVDTGIFHPPVPDERDELRDEPFTVLSAGRMQPLKGQQVLIRALGMLRREHPDVAVRLVLAGTGSPGFQEHLRELAAEEGVAGAVEFRGSLPREELAQLMGSVDAVAVASSSETFGLVAVEAQACATPVLATDVDGLRYAVRNGETGWLIPDRDPASWADALYRAARHPAGWRAMSHPARHRASELTWDDVAAQHACAYLACAARQHAA